MSAQRECAKNEACDIFAPKTSSPSFSIGKTLAMAQQGNLDELVSNIVNYPNFRESLNAAFNSRREQEDARAISMTPPTNSVTARPTTSNRPNGNINFAGRSESRTFEHSNDELSSIFRTGGSSSQVRNPHRFE